MAILQPVFESVVPHRVCPTARLLISGILFLSCLTSRNILRGCDTRCRKYKTANGNRRYKADLRKYAPFEFWQSLSALPEEACVAIFKNKLPLYQFTAIDIKTRLRLLLMPIRCLLSTGFLLCCW